MCSKCNLSFKNNIRTLPIVVHNLSYDLCLILKEAKTDLDIRINKKQGMKFYSARFKNLKFIDSMNFLKGSLGKLANEHIKNKGEIEYTKSEIKDLPLTAQELLLNTGKQFLPYEYISSFDRLKETEIPPKSAFYSSLKKSEITEKEYEHVRKVWNACKCTSLKDYLIIYLKLDVALLADVFIKWRQTLLDLFQLDCLYFLTLASYAFEAFLHKTKVELDAISDPDLYQLINRNIRGGFCSVGKRHAKANNKDINFKFRKGVDKSNYLLYIDFNSLYPTCMSTFKLPKGGFRKLEGREFSDFINQDLTMIDSNGEEGYYIHCDIQPVSKDVIEKTDSFPLIMSKKDVKFDHLSSYSQELLKKCMLSLMNLLTQKSKE